MIKLTTTILALSALTFSAQNTAKISGVSNLKEKLAAKNQISFEKEKASASKTNNQIPNNPSASQKGNLSVTNFTAFSSSANIYGVLTNASKPLHYNDNLNAVSFIQRKSASYVGSPNNNTGVIVAMISADWGANWDSTCIYSDATNFGRYPQGAIYNPPGNTNLANAYAVGSGPCTDGGSWTGNWFASKQLGVPSSTVYNNAASVVPNAQQFFSSAGPFGPNVFSNDFAQYGFNSSDDGKVKSLGILAEDPDAAPIDARGAVIQTGSFNAGVFDWKTDSFLPPVTIKTDAYRQMNSNANMAWNETGTVGYVVFLGSRTGQTLSNTGWQPIVYKTTNSGTSWALMPGIDFNNSAFQLVKKRLDAVSTNSNLVIPMCNPYEGIDCAVDANDRLHIATIIASTASSHNDSLAYTNEYTTEGYTWPHGPNQHPYLYDFIGDGTGPWTFLTVDSLSSEAPSSVSGYPGFADNPWDDDAGKVTSDARVQLSRTPDGQHIIYAYAESDTNFTQGGKKWNNLPNVKAKMWSAGLTVPISSNKINITKPSVGLNPSVANRAMFHFASPNSGTATVNGYTVDVKMPLTVTNSNPYIQGTSNTHYYSTENLNFIFSSPGGFNEVNKSDLQFSLYPNPATQTCFVELNLNQTSDLEISVLNYLGQVVKQKNYKSQFGKSQFEIELTNLKAGIYFVSLKTGNISSTKKLVVE
ncbi:MAG: T9SS type A sorting domain-containing protein [Bacteroidota bacterium]|nr:T9SS type A sorting domain-containing protein [Bacteroidota bacterium]